MKRQLVLVSTLLAVLMNAHAPAIAENWFDKYDRDHDHHWNYDEFRAAHNAYWKKHKDEKRLTDAELRAEFDRRAAEHKGWLDTETVRDFHHW